MSLLELGAGVGACSLVGLAAWHWPEIRGYLAQLIERDLWG